MENESKIKNIKITKKGNVIKFDYEMYGEWNKLLEKENKFWLEFEKNIENVPDSIAIIPLIVNILPISWAFDLEIDVDEIDKTFYNCINNIKNGYERMYPSLKFKGSFKYNKIIENKINGEKCGTLFSGGVDATNTLIQNIKYKPDLITVWGSDIDLDDVKGWNIVKENHKKVANELELNFYTIKSNFRSFLNNDELNKFIYENIVGSWWHEMQHGIGLIGLVAPLSYINGYNNVYIASSFTAKDIGKYTCASDPTIDNELKYADCITTHDGYEFNRQQKIENICKYATKNNKKINLRVCWESKGGKNCGHCEKCCRTMLGILAEKADPNDYGFEYNEEVGKNIKNIVKLKYKYNQHRAYLDIQNKFKENYSNEEIPDYLRWFRNVKIIDKKDIPNYVIFTQKVHNKIKRILKIK